MIYLCSIILYYIYFYLKTFFTFLFTLLACVNWCFVYITKSIIVVEVSRKMFFSGRVRYCSVNALLCPPVHFRVPRDTKTCGKTTFARVLSWCSYLVLFELINDAFIKMITCKIFYICIIYYWYLIVLTHGVQCY